MLRVVLKPLISDIPLIGGVQVSSLTHIRDLDPDLDTIDRIHGGMVQRVSGEGGYYLTTL